ncbi:hypothetical protein EON65_42040 [archaeon]|nr:MAG: hypothetical protein EON65_42040 [archaeon]
MCMKCLYMCLPAIYNYSRHPSNPPSPPIFSFQPHNILLTLEGRAKVADLGTAVCVAEGQRLWEPAGTSGYTAPEVLQAGEEGKGGKGYSFPADVFSLAIVLWELMQPFSPRLSNPLTGLNPTVAVEQMTEGLRPPWGETHVGEVREIVGGAWATLPDERPTCSQLLERVEQVLRRLRGKDKKL